MSPDPALPLVLLDVDGVVNDLPAALGVRRPWEHHRLDLGEITVCIPRFVPPLLQYLDLIAEIHWLSTWGDLANLLLPDILGVGPYPVVGADVDQTNPRWKPGAARPLVESVLAVGRPVYWIEDFEGEYPTDLMPPGVTYVDTAAEGDYVLLPSHLPAALLPEGLRGLAADRPAEG